MTIVGRLSSAKVECQTWLGLYRTEQLRDPTTRPEADLNVGREQPKELLPVLFCLRRLKDKPGQLRP